MIIKKIRRNFIDFSDKKQEKYDMVYRFEDDFLEDMTGYQLRVERVQLEQEFVRHTHSRCV